MYSFKEVFLLDLCTLAYQLHSQSLVWPMDPYYEQLFGLGGLRDQFMNDVRTTELKAPSGADPTYWGPSAALDPIYAKYDRVYPWRPSFTRAQPGEWILYNTPDAITDRIASVKIAIRDRTQPPAMQPSPAAWLGGPTFAVTNPAAGGATDWLYCFEGCTGRVNESDLGAWSLLGLVLVEFQSGPTGPYDVYIVFRGSRSGRIGLKRFLKYYQQKGNADWVTDLSLPKVGAEEAISDYGTLCAGFRLAVKSAFPTIMLCLEEIAQQTQGRPPRTIYVTGHSLGAALAAHFTSAVTLGNPNYYGPWGQGRLMPQALQNWPWRSIQLTTFSAPAVGSEDFQLAFDSRVPSTRIWVDGDPITQERINSPVGVPVRLPAYSASGTKSATAASLGSHEPAVVRRSLITRWRNFAATKLDDVPANLGRAEAGEPWTVFRSYAEMILQLKGLPKTSGSPGVNSLKTLANDFKGFACDFAQNFISYERHLSRIVASGASRTAAQSLDAFQKGQVDATTMGVLQRELRPDLYDFICICYALYDASSSSTLDAYTCLTGPILTKQPLK